MSPYVPAAPAAAPISPFGQKVTRAAAESVVNAVPKVGAFVEQQGKNVLDALTGKLPMTPQDLLTGVKKTAGGASWLAQGINEGVVRILKSVGESVAPVATGKISYNPVVSAFGETITGKDTVVSYQDIYHTAHTYALDNNAAPKEAGTFASLAVLGTMFADNPLFGPEGKGIKLSVEALKTIAETADEKTIITLVKKENPSMTDVELAALAPALRDAKTPDEVSKVVAAAHAMTNQKPAPPASPEEKPAETRFGKGGITVTDKGEFSQYNFDTKTIEKRGSIADVSPALRKEFLDARNAYEKTKGTGAENTKPAFDRYQKAEAAVREVLGISEEDLAREKAAFEASQTSPRNLPKNITSTATAPSPGSETNVSPRLIETRSPGAAPKSILYTSPSHSYNFADPAIYRDYSIMRDNAQTLKESFGDSVARILGKQPEISIKTEKSFTEKNARYAESGREKAIPDTLRGRVVLPQGDIPQAIEKLKENLNVVKVKNYSQTPTTFGHHGVHVLIEHPNGFISELQLHTPASLRASNAVRPLYEKWKNININTASKSVRMQAEADAATARKISDDIMHAHEKESPEPGFDQRLVRDIANQKAQGPIADTLAKRFPHLPAAVTNSAAGRLARMNRTSDIEGMLAALAKIQDDARRRKGIFSASGPVERRGGFTSVADVMGPREKDVYIKTITHSLQDKESAVLAQQEYEALWENANQTVIDHYAQTSLERDFLREAIQNNPIREIYKMVYGFGRSPSDSQYELQEIFERALGKTDSHGQYIPAKGLPGVSKEKLRMLDRTIESAGFKDFPAAQEAVERYEKSLDTLKKYEENVKALRTQVKVARILQDFIDDVPVVTRARAGAVDVLANPDWIRTIYKDITGFKSYMRDPLRNFEHFFGPKFKLFEEAVWKPFHDAMGATVDEWGKLGDELGKNIVDPFGFQRGSLESAAIQRYGDTGLEGGERLTEDTLIEKFGREKAQNIIAADAWFRQTYDRLIDEINAVRANIYPNNPNKLIPKRGDYYRHFRELGGSFAGLKNIFETAAGIDPTLAGTSEFTRPKSKFLSFAQERTGKRTEIDAIGGFIDYAEYFAYAKHIDPQISAFQYLRKKIAEQAPVPEKLEVGGKYAGQVHEGVNNFLDFLNTYAQDLAGKTSPADRWMQAFVPGGRKTFRVLNWANNRIKANTILMNLSSSIAQIFNVPQGIASAKLYSLPGIERTFASLFHENKPAAESTFLKERYREDLRNRFKIDWAQHPIQRGTEEGKQFAAWLTRVLDEVGTKFIWNAHYAKGVAEGVKDPIFYADQITGKMVGDRGIGKVPLLQNSKVFQVLAPFQLEVGNLWYVMGDFGRRKDFAAIVILFAANYLMNRSAEKIRGSPVVYDPIQATIDGGTQFADEMNAGEGVARASLKFAGRELGEVLSNLPVGQTIAAITPDSWISQGTGGVMQNKKDFFGTSDPGRFGPPTLLISSLADPFYRLLPPFGGLQAEKTIGAVKAMLSGIVQDKNGKLSFKTPGDPASLVQAFLFGKNATAAAQQAYATRDDLFQRIYRQTADRNTLTLDAEQAWGDLKQTKKINGPQAAAAALKDIAKKNPLLAQKIADIAAQEAKGLDGTDRLIQMLGIENGERAKYIMDAVKKLPKKVRGAFLSSLAQKGLLTDPVVDQMTALIGK